MLSKNHNQLEKHPNDSSLSVERLSCVRGERLLFEGLSFTVAAGQCLHITGANGSGKSSLLKIVSGINQADKGQVLWRGSAINNPDFYRVSAYIGHRDGLKNELTAAENLSFYHQLEGANSDDEEIDLQLLKMGLLECADLTADKLSFGQRRRLTFARLLQANFSLWILDEPFTGIDIAGRQLIERLCLQHLQKQGLIILTNHQNLGASTLADYLLELAL